MHQLRVAAVGKLVCDNFREPVHERDVVLACLFHDTGNIIKSDLATFPEFLEPEGYAHWQEEKDNFVRKYGTDEHAATIAIARELALPQEVLAYIDGIGFSALHATRDSLSYEQKICEYADLRVGPYGILSLDERIAEAGVRYRGRHKDMPANEDAFSALARSAHEIESQIFSRTNIGPTDITDASAAPVIEELWDYPIS